MSPRPAHSSIPLAAEGDGPVGCAALGQAVALMGGGRPGLEVGRVIGQQSRVQQLLLFPSRQQSPLRFFPFVGPAARVGFDTDAIQRIPEILGAEMFGREGPEGLQNGGAVLIGDLGLGSRLADAMECRQQEIMGGGGTRARRGPGHPPRPLPQKNLRWRCGDMRPPPRAPPWWGRAT